MRTYRAFIVAALTSLAAVFPAQGEGPSEDFAILPIDKAEEVVRFYRRAPLGSSVDGYWFPSRSEVLEAEKRLPDFFAKAKKRPKGGLETFNRQYMGIVVQGRKILYISFFSKTSIDMDWKREPAKVFDGGDIFWRIEYDPESGTFSNYQANGGY